MEDEKILQEDQTDCSEIDTEELDRIAGGSSYSQDGEWVINNNSD